MKNKIVAIFFAIVWFNYFLIARELDNQVIPVGWLDCQEVYVSEGTFSIYTNVGLVAFKVLEYDEEGRRYLVECIKYGNDYYPRPEGTLE